MNKKLTIGILAHVDAGKTTLSEAILYKTGELRKLGRVDHQDAFLDDTAAERNRGITIFSKQARFKLPGSSQEAEVVLIDTPGHVDFSAEMERTLAILDYALLVISGSEGVQAHTKTLYRMLRERHIPIFIFVNKMDIAVRQRAEIIAELNQELKYELSDRGSNEAMDNKIASLGRECRIGAVDFKDATHSEDFIDDVTLISPKLADIVLEEGRELTDIDIAHSIKRCEIAPCIFGSALKLSGIDELIETLARFTLKPRRKENLAGIIYKIGSTETGERLAYIKLTGGILHTRDRVIGHTQGHNLAEAQVASEDWAAKVNQIRLYSGSRYVSTDEACAGEVCAVTGLPEARAGDTIGDEIAPNASYMNIAPYIVSTVRPPEGMDPFNVMKDLSKLAIEDPALNIKWHPSTKEIELRLMGEVQLEVLTGMIRDRFGYDVTFESGHIMYLETIENIYEGVGHFEPLRHYAEVHLLVEAAERGTGISITSDAPEDELARNWQRLILTNIAEKEHIGVLTGAPLTDVKITLVAGKAHDKHTSGGDFREATYRAIRNALMQARRDGKAILLEPWLYYEISLPSSNVGRAMTDIKHMGGSQSSLEQLGDISRIRGLVPASKIAGYELVLLGYTGGMGRISCSQAGYMPCHNTDEVMAEAGYDPERDIENSADSVMVNHDGSDIVKWDQIFDAMHLPSVLATRQRIADNTSASKKSLRGGSGPGTGRDPRLEKELQHIFENTYGAKKSYTRKEARTTDYSNSYRLNSKNSDRSRDSDSPEIILIDGYNLIYADEYLKDLTKIDSGAARDQLIERVGNYAAYLGYEVIMVFDAYSVPYGSGSEQDIHGIRVIYTRENEPADIRIGAIINSLIGDGTSRSKKSRLVYSVSSDNLVQQNAFASGALRISSKDFLQTMTDVESRIRSEL